LPYISFILFFKQFIFLLFQHSRRSPSGIAFGDVGIGIEFCGVGAERVPVHADGVGPSGVYSEGYAAGVGSRAVGSEAVCASRLKGAWCVFRGIVLAASGEQEGQNEREKNCWGDQSFVNKPFIPPPFLKDAKRKSKLNCFIVCLGVFIMMCKGTMKRVKKQILFEKKRQNNIKTD